MTEDADFDLEKFQEQVLNEFTFLKARNLQETFKREDVRREFRKSPWGCFLIPLFIFAGKFSDTLLRDEERKKNYEVFEKEAEDLLAQDEIKEDICKSLRNISPPEILTEDKFVKKVTEILAEKSLRKQFVIPLEPVLFAFIASQIFENGIENFCDQTKRTP